MMIKNSLNSILQTTRALLKNWHALAIFAGLFALLLATLYGFVATREATVWQVLLTLFFVATAPAIFFLLQAAIINRARAGRLEWYRALRDSTKLALLALPVILIGIGIMWLLNRWQAHFPAPHFNLSLQAIDPVTHQPSTTPPLHWPTVLFATLRGIIFAIVLPLALIHLWVEVVGQNLLAFVRVGRRAFLTRLRQILARVFAARSILIYSLGLIIFGVIPYALLFVHVPVNGAWSEMAIFTARLILVFVFILLGWVITLSTFAKNDGGIAPPRPLLEGEPIPLRSTGEREMSAV